MSSRVTQPTFMALILIIITVILAGSVFAASVGRIKGTVTDKKSGDPIFGTSVQIKGTSMGAKTDMDGHYLILSVPPGTYSLVFTSVGFQSIEMTDVDVRTDHTAERNIQLKESVLESGIITTVTGKQKGIDFLATGTVTVMTKEEIRAAPVTSVDELLSKETGITVDAEGQLHIRGGRAGETNYLVDGVSFSDPLGGRAPVDAGINISSAAILELQVIKDGFDPEYGEALSGIVTITSPVGSPDKTRSRLQYYTDDFGTEDLNKYSENTDIIEFSISGPDPILTSRILPALGINYFEDKDFTFYMYSRAYKTDTRNPYSRYNTPETQKAYPDFNLLGISVPERQNNLYNFDATLAFSPTTSISVKGLFKGTWSKWTEFEWVHRSSPETAPVKTYSTKTASLQIKQVLSKSSDYEVNLSYWGSDFVLKPGDPNHPGEGLDPDQFLFTDEYETYDDLNGNNQFDSYEPFLNIYPDSIQWGAVYIPFRNSSDIVISTDDQVGGPYLPLFDLNNNGVIDNYEGEPFVDLNGNGIWDMGDRLTSDVNGNSTFDAIYRDVTSSGATSAMEPYIDGDSCLGENFIDVNRNGVYDHGVDRFVTALDPSINMDLNRNNVYDGPNDGWEEGIPYIDYNGNGVYDPPNNRYDPGEPFVDINRNGVHDIGGDNNSAFLNYGFVQSGNSNVWSEETVDRWSAKGNFKKAIGRAHEIKAGFEFRNEKVTVSTITGLQNRDPDTTDTNPYSGRGTVRDFYSRSPNVLVLYFRDKIEYGSLVASLGLRADLFFQADLAGVPTIQDQTGHNLQDIRNKFSPRVSINYPISERAMIRFNYGHFYELPAYTRLYRTSNPFGQGAASLPQIGNPNLDYTKTINYTFGVNYAFTDEYSVKISGFYKDYFDMIATTSYERGGITLFSYYDNTDYARIRGFEMELAREAARFITGTLSYEYTFAYGKSSSDAENYQRLVDGNDISIDENPLGWDIRHRVALWLQLSFTKSDEPKLFGLSIPNDWDMSIYWRFQTGYPFTPSRDYPNMTLDVGETPQTNSMRLPSTAQTDIKLRKRFRIAGMQYTFEAQVNNLFDNENIVHVDPNTGRPDTDNNQSGVIGGGTDFSANPENWGRGRQILLGLGVQF